jgi:predicted DNA-binding transcriptional regulator AlpA
MGEREEITLAEAGRRAGLTAARMYQLAQRPSFPKVRRLGTYRLVDAGEVAQWLRERPADRGGRPPKPR